MNLEPVCNATNTGNLARPYKWNFTKGQWYYYNDKDCIVSEAKAAHAEARSVVRTHFSDIMEYLDESMQEDVRASIWK